VDYLGAQGYWVCVAVGALSLAVLTFRGKWMIGAFVFIIYFLGGVGVRERSRYAAASVFAMYLADILASGRPSIVSVILTGLLFFKSQGNLDRGSLDARLSRSRASSAF